MLDAPFDRQDNRIACGAHVLASAIRYWRAAEGSGSGKAGAGKDITGKAIFAAHPPADLTSGYSMQELVALSGEYGLSAFGVRLDEPALIGELEKGRPVLAPLLLPFVYEQSASLFDPDPPVIAQVKSLLLGSIGTASEMMKAGMLAHYVLIVGYSKDRFVLLDPVLGYRTISRERLARYRASYGGAGLVLSPRPTASHPD